MSRPATEQRAQVAPAHESDNGRAAYASAAIPSGIEGTQFLSDPVSDQLVRVVMELGAALWVERRRTRTLERVLACAGVMESHAVEQWCDAPEQAAEDLEELARWTKRIFGPLESIKAAGASSGNGGREE